MASKMFKFDYSHYTANEDIKGLCTLKRYAEATHLTRHDAREITDAFDNARISGNLLIQAQAFEIAADLLPLCDIIASTYMR